jgi:outer membrane protein OmpA-like peptidoglycan-associated protein
MLDFHGAVGGSLPAQRPGELLLGSHFYVGDFLDLHLGGGTGVMPGLGSPDWRMVAGLTIAPVFDPALRDSDKDGVADDRDQCKMELEDRDGFKDEDGCPDPDNDKDQIPDDKDKCPNDPEDDDGYNDEDGCPDPDNDGDGIPDMNDHCPLDPESMNGHADLDGCPDEAPTGNSDGDAFMDDVDRCPYDAEDVDGYADDDGCPDPDNDNDGILDTLDRCPNQREIFNGVDDEDGCPEDQRVVVEKDKIRITEVIYFDTGKATIQSRSHSLLDEIAATIQANPNIKKIRIEGHTDAQGNDSANLKLSQARAESVRVYLIRKGVAAERLDARGFGESYPIASNDTEAGRSQNRRVEFMITDKD